MAGLLVVLLGFVAYGLFLVTILYAIDFVGDFAVPRPGDSGMADLLAESLAADALLLGLFAAQPSLMPLPGGMRSGRAGAREAAE
jgi:hypothetical protein